MYMSREIGVSGRIPAKEGRADGRPPGGRPARVCLLPLIVSMQRRHKNTLSRFVPHHIPSSPSFSLFHFWQFIFLLSLTIFTKRKFVAEFLQAKCDFRRKLAVLRFWAPFGGLGATYDDHLRARLKARSGLHISVNWTFFARCYGQCATSEYRFKISDFTQTGTG